MRSLPFPRVEDRYSSLKEARIAIYTACYLGGHRLGTKQSSAHGVLDVRCSLAGLGRCSALVWVRPADKSSTRGVEIVESCEEHTCSASRREKDGDTARTFARRKLEDLEAPIPPLPSLLPVPPQRHIPPRPHVITLDSSDPETHSDIAESVVDISEAGPSYRSHIATGGVKRRKSKRASNPVERFGHKKQRRPVSLGSEADTSDVEVQSEEESKIESSRIAIPRSSDLVEEIRERKESCQVSLPSVDDEFSSLDLLFAQLYAYAAQSGFRFHRNASCLEHAAASVRCWKSSGCLPPSQRCPVKIHFRLRDGSWTIMEVISEHTHVLECEEESGDEAGEETTKPSKPSKSAKSKSQRCSAEGVASASATRETTFAPHGSTEPTPNVAAITPFSSNSHPLHSLDAPNSLSLLLRGIFPSTPTADLTLFSSFLTSLGITTAAGVLPLVFIEEDFLVHVIDGAKEKQGIVVEATQTVVRMVSELRECVKATLERRGKLG